MSQNSGDFLAASVLNDGNIESYRSLGRKLKVHSNAAKKMLFDFYTTQSIKSPGSINAIYLLNGVPKAPKQSSVKEYQQDGEKTHMQSTPYSSSPVPHQDDQEEATPSETVVLVNEEDLEAAKAKLKQIHSIHVYSLGPSRVQNLQILSDCNRGISAKYANEDPLVFQGQYGVIRNAGVIRRTDRRLSIGIPQIPAETNDEKARIKTKAINKQQKNAVRPFDGSYTTGKFTKSASKAVVAPETKIDEPTDVEKHAASKQFAGKGEESDVFRSFSMPRTRRKHENTDVSTGTSLAPNTVTLEPKSEDEDETMKEASEDEQEDVLMGSNTGKPRTSKSQSERAEQLRRMMEDEDEEMEDSRDDVAHTSQESGPLDGSTSQKETSPEPPVVVIEARRRGRRKVMKKKTMKDEEGYLVTIEEPAWESFSEDERPLQKQKTFASTAISSLAKGKKANGKPGQGSIMNFFGKK